MPISDENEMKLTAVISNAYTGDILAENDKDQPFIYNLANMPVLTGLAQELSGKEIGYKFDVVLTPDKAFGEHDPEKLRVLLKDECPKEISKGEKLILKLPHGEEVVYVKDVLESKVVVDSNPPLVGLTVRVRGEIVSLK